MRHRLFAKLVLAVALLLPGALAAQVEFKVGGGPSFPTGDFDTDVINGYNIHASVGFRPSFLPFDLRADYFYNDFKNEERPPSLDVSLGGEWFRQSGVVLNGVYALPLGRAAPYIVAGLGWVHEWYNDRSYNGRSHNTFTVNAGVGLDVMVLDRVGLFIEARRANLALGDELELRAPAFNDAVAFQSIPLTIGVKF